MLRTVSGSEGFSANCGSEAMVAALLAPMKTERMYSNHAAGNGVVETEKTCGAASCVTVPGN